MKILVANLGSTSFKYRLFDMADEKQLARGGVERIGAAEEPLFRRDRRPAAGTDGAGSRSRGGRAAMPGPTDRSGRAGA
jgi:hypothetical protein